MGRLQQGATTAPVDFVSSMDFTNLPLTRIPATIRCRGVSSREWSEFCDRIANRDSSVCSGASTMPPLNYATFLEGPYQDGFRLDCRAYTVDEESCRLQSGTFSGSIEASRDRITCTHEPDGTVVQLYNVSFRDMNHDGIMDAVLSIVEKSGGSAPSPRDHFNLTKRSEGGGLEWVP